MFCLSDKLYGYFSYNLSFKNSGVLDLFCKEDGK